MSENGNTPSQAGERRPLVFALPVQVGDLYARLPGARSREPGQRLLDLGRALAASPPWAKMRDGILVVRQAPEPLLGLLGYFDDEMQASVEALRWQLNFALERLRYVDYEQAERACEQLAARLVDRFGRSELQRFQFAGVPRGGLIALGMLSYVLDLKHEQMEPPFSTDRPLVIVDDCALTGLRFGRFLERYRDRPVVFAPLYSHPDLRVEIEEREPQVLACLSAHDLHDHAPEVLGGEYAEWRERWLDRSDDACYWIGQPDHICFPWNEPDIAIWNDVVEQEQQGWRVVPPARCLKNRPAPDAAHRRLQVQPPGKGPLRPSKDILYGSLDEEVIVASVETKQAYSLTGVAAEMWQAVVEHGSRKRMQRAMLEQYDVAESTLRADVDRFINDLAARGLIEEDDSTASEQ